MSFKDIILVKLGGAIIEHENNLTSSINQFKTLIFKKNIIKKVIIIPGGGSYANFIRYIDKKSHLGDDLAHWEAILAMNWNAFNIHNKFRNTNLISEFSSLQKTLKENSESEEIIIFQPFTYLKYKDELPHSWTITSDSIALYIANKYSLNVCYLIKDVDGILDKNFNLIRTITTQELRKLKNNNLLANLNEADDIKLSRPIDQYSLKLIDKYKLECVFLNGSGDKNRILEYFSSPSENKKKYTRIIK
ncbi:MAG: hypothetical protein EU543_03350 [Promethearchaeota archaeon]|nr:MAG: hypothetical protein EU543_03350 [Candidatus Lokiarchaeota archaeon]